MGLDIGEVRTGVAVCDPLWIVASPLTTLAMTGKPRADAQTIAALAQEIAPERVVAGIPLDQHGAPGPQARKVAAVVEELRGLLSVPVETLDERFSTAEAQRRLRQDQVTAKNQKRTIDQISAVILLETYMRREQNRGA